MLRNLIPLMTCAVLSACDASTAGSGDAGVTDSKVSRNQLSLRIDGKPWHAERELYGDFHPPGLDQALLISGEAGPGDGREQAFNLNLYRVKGPGRHTLGATTMNTIGLGDAIQLANFSESVPLMGGPFGFEGEVELLQAGQGTIEARFSGQLTGNDGRQYQLTDGYFLYRE
jgi:hypothetical protein